MSLLPARHSRHLAEAGGSCHRHDDGGILPPVATRGEFELTSNFGIEDLAKINMKNSVTAESIRPPAVAGRFYPGDPDKLRRMVDSFMGSAKISVRGKSKAVIAPHAGYAYSGPIAASAFVHFAGERDTIKRIILLGPSHRFAFEGIALSHAEAFATPRGTVPVDKAAVNRIETFPAVCFEERAHLHEHSLEVELPFLQATLNDFTVVPLVVGDATDDEVAEVIDQLWGGDETRFVISSDLSHYYDYESARELDRCTAQNIERNAGEAITAQHACGYRPIRGFLQAAQRRQLHAQTVDLRNSGDTAGPRDQVVGYGAFVFNESQPSSG